MSSYPFNTSFTKQFRQEQPVTFCAEEKPVDNLVISTYGRMNELEINALGKSLNEQLFNNSIIHRLLTKTQKDSQDAERLTAFIKDAHGELCTNASAEPFTAQYYKHLIELFATFL